MEAHSLLQRHGFDVSSYGTGVRVKLAGPSYREPNVYEFGTPYHKMYDDLLRKNPELYKRNGILPMLKRNMSVKLAPQCWQDNAADGPFDVVLSFKDRVSDVIIDGYWLKEMVLALFSESDLCLSDDVVDQIVDKTFMEADKKGDGKIDLDEWKEFVDINPSLLNNMTLPYLKEKNLFTEIHAQEILQLVFQKFCPNSRFPTVSSDEGFNNHRAAGARLEGKDVDNNKNSNNSRSVKIRRKDKEIAFEATSTLSSSPPEQNRSLELKELVEYDTHPPPGASEETIRGRFKEAYRTAPHDCCRVLDKIMQSPSNEISVVSNGVVEISEPNTKPLGTK
ncbi:uncharacterized protein A4U43_C07F11730 [Asparagus officinalis]|uniref:protein-serine/threonine phosphatase n=1 Tax=Asparagus officinalis TaxID=4686 RepID=A0A5P1EEI0_ASPOF|nr:uncharacterized protein A4U43_C07F11730 [Asparagus officinalis]